MCNAQLCPMMHFCLKPNVGFFLSLLHKKHRIHLIFTEQEAMLKVI